MSLFVASSSIYFFALGGCPSVCLLNRAAVGSFVLSFLFYAWFYVFMCRCLFCVFVVFVCVVFVSLFYLVNLFLCGFRFDYNERFVVRPSVEIFAFCFVVCAFCTPDCGFAFNSAGAF